MSTEPKRVSPKDYHVPVHELEKITNLPTCELHQHLQLLEKYELLKRGFDDDFGQPQLELHSLETGWEILAELKAFSERTSVTLEELLVEMDFSHLD